MIGAVQRGCSSSEPDSSSLGKSEAGSPLRNGEMRQLPGRFAGGDLEARNALVQANLGLVIKVAREFSGRGLTMEDLIGEGNLGLIRAADEYDPRQGTRFSTCATYWIRESINTALINTGATIRVPLHTFKLLARWRRTEQELHLSLGYPPGFDEVADRMGLTPLQKGMVEQARLVGRLELASVLAARGATWMCRILASGETPEAVLEAEEERKTFLRRLERLESRERTVLIMRYGLGGGRPMTFDSIGRRLGATREWARRIEMGAIRKLVVGGVDETAPSLPVERFRVDRPGLAARRREAKSTGSTG